MPDLVTLGPFLEPHHHEVAAEARLVAEQIAALQPQHDDDGARRQARQIVQILGDAKLTRHAVPTSFNAATRPDLRACALIRETLAAASPLADSVFALQCLGSMPIILAGSDRLRQEVLPDVVAGRRMAAFAMTEPEAGSDVSGMQTRARRAGDREGDGDRQGDGDGEGWILDGGKHLITNAGEADFYCVFAVTDAAAGNRGLSCFFVEADNPGFRFVQAQVLSEPHPLGEIAFEHCQVPADALLGEPGEGFKIGMRTLDRLRPTVAAAACGMAQRALDEALAHAQQRQQFGQPLSAFQLTQQKLARMATDLTAARLLTYRAAWAGDQGQERITLEAAMAKSFATEAAQRAVDDAVQIVGGRGALANHPVDRLYRAVRALRIYEGTTEIQHLVIARHLLHS